MGTDVRHLTSTGEVVHFVNRDNLYPVNQYQSLILAAVSEFAALRIAQLRKVRLADLAAWEVCCGGGPAAVTLKRIGVGHVQATDISPESVTSCLANADENGVTLDRATTADLLADGEERLYDLICCNPPCGPDVASTSSDPAALRVAVRGGETGVEVTTRLLEHVRERLTPGGSLVFVAVSTSDVLRLAEQLDEAFPGQWRTFPTTPVAAPYRMIDDPSATWLAQPPTEFAPLVWPRPDGWYWRLTWVVEVTNDVAAAFHSGFVLAPYGYEVTRDPELVRMIDENSGDGYWLSTDRTTGRRSSGRGA